MARGLLVVMWSRWTCLSASALLGELRLPANSEDEVRTTIQSLVRSNSLQTMLALRERLEGEARCVPSQV